MKMSRIYLSPDLLLKLDKNMGLGLEKLFDISNLSNY